MKVISTTDVSRGGNDCYINQEIALIEFCGIYAIIECTNITGWFEDKSINVVCETENYDEAIEFYKMNNGILED